MSGGEAGTKFKSFLAGVGGAQKALGMQFTDSAGNMLPVLTILANGASILGAALYCSPTLDVSIGAYVVQTLNSLEPWDIGQGLAKSFVFAALITLVGVSTGFSVTGGAEGVGRATTRAVVLSISALVIADMMFSYFLNR